MHSERMIIGTLGMLVVLVTAVGGVIALIIVAAQAQRAKEKKAAEPPPPPIPSRTSFLAGMSFLSGLASIGAVAAAGIVAACVSMSEVTGVPIEVHPHMDMGSRIVLYGSVLPAVMAIAFALAARGAITESRGTLRGRSLYRTGILLAMVSGMLTLNGKVLKPENWTSVFAGAPGGAGGAGSILHLNDGSAESERGYLGVQLESSRKDGGSRVVHVVAGAPAERAGLKAGDLVVKLDGVSLADGSPLAERIGAMKPGTRVTLSVVRGEETLALQADLGAPFSALIETLESAQSDSSRLAVLRAAGEERRYTAAELRKICDTFAADSGRISAIELALPHLSDPENAYQILNALVSGSSKEQVSRMIVERLKPKK